MRVKLLPILVFITVFVVYLGMGTKWTFEPFWALDYFNNQAEALISGKLNIFEPGSTYDLIFF